MPDQGPRFPRAFRGGMRLGDANAPRPAAQPTFPQFKKLPPEIQTQIFIEALGKPKIHIVMAKRVLDENEGTWTLSFAPVAKKQDTSGYRRLQELASVNRRAYAAMRMATARHNVRLPFAGLRSRIDGVEDLVVIDLPQSTVHHPIGYFHPDHQILALNGHTFDGRTVTAKFQGVHKVALKYSDQHHPVNSIWSSFGCVTAGEPHDGHRGWYMCPDQVFGLLNLFPNLREIYLIIHPARHSAAKMVVTAYTKNFFSRKPLTPSPPSSLSL